MAEKLVAALPPNLDLNSTYTIRFTALDPSTGDPVSGVVVDNAMITAQNIGASTAAQLQTGPFLYVQGPSA